MEKRLGLIEWLKEDAQYGGIWIVLIINIPIFILAMICMTLTFFTK